MDAGYAAGRCWPARFIQLNPEFEPDHSIDQVVCGNTPDADCVGVFPL